MAKIKLKKRTYLGEGYVHQFINDDTGEIVKIPCTKEEYERLGEPGGSKYNPTLEGYRWVASSGGTDKVDTPDTTLGLDEYCVKGDHIVAVFKDKGPEWVYKKLDIDDIDENDDFDEEKYEQKQKHKEKV